MDPKEGLKEILKDVPVWCRAPGPYPEIKVKEPNAYYGQLLLQAYAGKWGEVTAHMTYIYHDTATRVPALGEIWRCIARVEQFHMQYFGMTIKALGVDPQYYVVEDTTQVLWTPEYIHYGTDICDRLKADINAEQMAANVQNELITRIDDPHVQAILARVVRDEMWHKAIFTEAHNYFECTPKMPMPPGIPHVPVPSLPPMPPHK